MKLQSIFGYALAGVSLLIGIGFFMHRPLTVETPKSDISPKVPTSYIEMMPSSSDQLYRLHRLNAAGVEIEVRTKYKDGSDGFLQVGPNGKTVREHRNFPDGSDRKDAVYDADGVLISGFEYRIDHTLLWTTALSTDQSKTITWVFWPGGKVFLQREYERASKVIQSTFYRESGMRWQEAQYKGNLLLLEKTFDESGRLRRLIKVDPQEIVISGGAPMYGLDAYKPFMQVVYFNEDGRPQFHQWFGYAAQHYFDPESGRPNPNALVLKRVGIYVDGHLTSEYQLTSDRRITIVDQIDASGTVSRAHVQSNGSITQIDTITPGAVTTRFDFEGGFGRASPLDSRYVVPLPDPDALLVQFNTNEAQLKEAQAQNLRNP